MRTVVFISAAALAIGAGVFACRLAYLDGQALLVRDEPAMTEPAAAAPLAPVEPRLEPSESLASVWLHDRWLYAASLDHRKGSPLVTLRRSLDGTEWDAVSAPMGRASIRWDDRRAWYVEGDRFHALMAVPRIPHHHRWEPGMKVPPDLRGIRAWRGLADRVRLVAGTSDDRTRTVVVDLTADMSTVIRQRVVPGWLDEVEVDEDGDLVGVALREVDGVEVLDVHALDDDAATARTTSIALDAAVLGVSVLEWCRQGDGLFALTPAGAVVYSSDRGVTLERIGTVERISTTGQVACSSTTLHGTDGHVVFTCERRGCTVAPIELDNVAAVAVGAPGAGAQFLVVAGPHQQQRLVQLRMVGTRLEPVGSWPLVTTDADGGLVFAERAYRVDGAWYVTSPAVRDRR